jgi:SAM-dependent methyltransferase
MNSYTFIDTQGCVEHSNGYCTLCGSYGTFLSHEPIDFPCKRNSFTCQICGSLARNRHVAHTILMEFRHLSRCSSLSEFAASFDGNIWIGCVKEAISRSLGFYPNVIRSEFIDGMDSGQAREDGVMCQDIQATSFPDNYFDLIISEEVLEHVPYPGLAFQEIRRILKPGGKHIFTIPIDWSAPKSYARASLVDGQLVHHHPPEIHGDPFRTDGVLAFYTFGHDVIDTLCSLTGPTKLLSAHEDKMMERVFSIYNNWVFVSEKT